MKSENEKQLRQFNHGYLLIYTDKENTAHFVNPLWCETRALK